MNGGPSHEDDHICAPWCLKYSNHCIIRHKLPWIASCSRQHHDTGKIEQKHESLHLRLKTFIMSACESIFCKGGIFKVMFKACLSSSIHYPQFAGNPYSL